MAIGPGKYDLLCTLLREHVQADGILVIVVNGPRGSGFSAQATAEVTARLPELLRAVADGIERDQGGGT